ncbi:Myb transcription factor [Balamuthia mandrillaris]
MMMMMPQLTQQLLWRLAASSSAGKSQTAFDAACLDIFAVAQTLHSTYDTRNVLALLWETLKKYNCEEVFQGLVQLMRQSGVEGEYLLENGLSEGTLLASQQQQQRYKTENRFNQHHLPHHVTQPHPPPHLLQQRQQLMKQEQSSSSSSSLRKRKELAGHLQSSSSSTNGSSSSGTATKKTKSGHRARSSPDKWTAEEDAKLIALVGKYGTENRRWKEVARELGTTKTGASCAQHWRRVLAPSIDKSTWTEQEETILLNYVKLLGKSSWSEISNHLPGRTDIQCRYHYIRQKNSRKVPWSDKEDRLLSLLVEEANKQHSGTPCWVEIAERMAAEKLRSVLRTPRTALECKER